MDTIGERLDFARKQKGKSYAALAEHIGGISGDAIRKAIKRDTVKDYYINTLSEYLRINKEWILTGKGEIYLEDSNEVLYSSKGSEIEVDKVVDIILANYDKFLSNKKFKIILDNYASNKQLEFLKKD